MGGQETTRREQVHDAGDKNEAGWLHKRQKMENEQQCHRSFQPAHVISIRSNTQTFSTLKGSENMHMVWSLLPVIMSNDSPQHVDMLSMLRSVSGPESVQIFQSITISMLWRLQVEKWSLWFIFNDMHAPRCSHLHAYTRAQTIYAMERWTGF